MRNVIITIICSIVFLFLGLVIGAKNILPSNFFDIDIYQVVNIVLTVIIGFFVAYYLNNKNSKYNKKIEYIIKLCSELDIVLDEKSLTISEYLKDYSDDMKKKSILLFFKTISSKVSIMKNLDIVFCKSGVDFINNKCEEYRNSITGDEWGKRTSFDDLYIENFKKDISSCRSTIQKMISDCLTR
jgi:hypothetical protein